MPNTNGASVDNKMSERTCEKCSLAADEAPYSVLQVPENQLGPAGMAFQKQKERDVTTAFFLFPNGAGPCRK